MSIADRRDCESPALSRLLELVRQTNRYDICEVEPGHYEVRDNRYLLDQLLRLPELRPGTDNLLESHLDELLGELSSGPALDICDIQMLTWLLIKVQMVAPETQNPTYDIYDGIYDSACVLRGTFQEVEYFLRSALDHRVQ
jgi:hypothetical protein